MASPIEVEIWSDVVCPFCYIGKRNLEAALASFPDRANVSVVWRSFELDPDASKERPTGDIYDLLAKKYGRDRAWAIEANKNVTEIAAKAGLKFDMARVIPSSSFDAHRLIHLAESLGLQDQTKERFLKAYFTDGEHLSDPATLKRLALEVGLPSEKIDEVLGSDLYAAEVREDEDLASQLGVRGVPFFVFNRKFAVSGAQPVDVFTRALKQS